jgi:RNA polymerase sigma factor (TIGR02999 family)
MEASLTILLRRAQLGDRAAEGKAFDLMYARLRGIAAGLMRNERRGHTWQTAALIHEAFLTRLRKMRVRIEDREHYYSLVAGAMRQVLMDYGRRRRASKRTCPEGPFALIERGSATAEDIQTARCAVAKLAKIDAGAARVVELRFFEEMRIEEIAAALGRPVWRVRADCEYALEWMGAHCGA